MDTTKYPVGIQTFEILRERHCVYADKTEYIYRMATSGSTTFFLNRPRRFGKSLLLSTIEAYFRGRKDLFEGLAIYELEKDWESYPVLRFDFSQAQAKSADDLTEFISKRLSVYEREFGITDTSDIKAVGFRFGSLIESISKSTGKRLVILIDEYDKGIHEVIDNEAQLRANQDVLRPFFSQIKSQGEYLRFCFITGVARFRNYTLFSGFNNPDDLSMQPKYAGICGFTENELLDKFHDGIQALAQRQELGLDQTLELLRQKYDGYRFTVSDELVYNPFSIVNCLNQQLISDFWVKSGVPKVFVDFLKKSNFDLTELEDIWTTQASMEGTYSTDDPIPLLFQTGYLTIAQTRANRYRLRIPNGEVRSALVDDLIPRFMGVSRNRYDIMAADIWECLDTGDVDRLMTVLQAIVAKIPYHELDIPNIEKSYHLAIYELFLILGVDSRSEVAISGGRIDMVVTTLRYIYVIEFKLGGTPAEALAQIDDRGYALPWSADSRQTIKVGAVFSPATRTISSWAYM